MAASLRLCPAGLAAPASSSNLPLTRRPPRSTTLQLGLAGRNNPKPINLNLKTRQVDGIIIRARNGAAGGLPVVKPQVPDEIDYDFSQERDRIEEYHTKISNTGLLDQEATALLRYICRIVKDSVRVASILMGKPSAISRGTPLTTLLITPTYREKRTLQMYVRIFVDTAEDAYNNRVTRETIVSFLGALQGVATMSHMMAQHTLAMPHCTPDCDVSTARREYTEKMDSLKYEFKTAEPYNAFKIVKRTITDAIILTQRFVISMSVCGKNALGDLFPGATRLFDSGCRPAKLLGRLHV